MGHKRRKKTSSVKADAQRTLPGGPNRFGTRVSTPSVPWYQMRFGFFEAFVLGLIASLIALLPLGTWVRMAALACLILGLVALPISAFTRIRTSGLPFKVGLALVMLAFWIRVIAWPVAPRIIAEGQPVPTPTPIIISVDRPHLKVRVGIAMLHKMFVSQKPTTALTTNVTVENLGDDAKYGECQHWAFGPADIPGAPDSYSVGIRDVRSRVAKDVKNGCPWSWNPIGQGEDRAIIVEGPMLNPAGVAVFNRRDAVYYFDAVIVAKNAGGGYQKEVCDIILGPNEDAHLCPPDTMTP